MYGTTLKLVMEKESMMVLVHALKLPFACLRDAASIVQWCASVMGEQATRKHLVRRIFWEVTNVDRSQTPRVNTVHGTRQFHSIRSSDNSALQIWTRLKACFCSSCSIGEWDDCEHTDTVDTWERVHLVAISTG